MTTDAILTNAERDSQCTCEHTSGCRDDCCCAETTATETARFLVVLRPEFGSKGVDRIIALAHSGLSKAKVFLEYVEDMDPLDGLYVDDAYFDSLRQKGHDILDPQVKRIRDAGLDVEVLPSYFGIAAEEILRVEKQIQPDVVVVDVPQYSAFRRLFNRDFSDEVVRKAKAPVLAIGPKDEVSPRLLEPVVTCHCPQPVAA